ncbi:hypothetical protein LMG19083_04650 [Ralstonia psammae]|uniref:DUF3617 domain-containing protein n=1 Tax=Ralstonia psammae TaxID=3058598 RepID=A0ABM9JY18_9RALS|nr:DUF3617 family protein [Ralstonia sp. LMG 19083]CAJ0808058.1 hypothetical protein LMG19083_04650 [Ralstonia sp. LMG 19083]
MKLWCGGVLLAGLAGLTLGAHAQEVTPGLWESTTSVTLNGKPLPHFDDQGRQVASRPERGCLNANDAGDVRAMFERSIRRDQQGCKLTRWNYTLGTLKVTLSCEDPQGGKGVLEASGPLTPTSYNISGNGQYQHPQFGPMKSGFHYQGRYLGACKS